MPGGEGVEVTAHNRLRYVHLLAHHHLNRRIAAQSAAFLRGFRDLVHPSWAALFR